MQPTLCSKCKKNVAVVFISRQNEKGEMVNEGLCLKCAAQLGLPQVEEMMKRMGISPEDLENINNEMMQAFGGAEELSDMPAPQDEDDEDDGESGKTATFPFLNRLFGGSNPPAEKSDAPSGREEAPKGRKADKKHKYLDSYCINLSQRARDGKLDAVIGREEEIQRVVQILNRRQKNNPCLIGEPGVGKTAIAEGLAQRIAAGDVPFKLRDKQVYLLDLTALVAGTQFRGQFESRMKGLIEEIRKLGNIILVIDEVHNIVGAGDAEGSMNAANILKPALSRGEIQVIGATTFNEYRKHIEKDAALERRFQPVMVDEPSQEEAIEILKGIKDKYEAHHKVKITDEAIESAVKLSTRYIGDRYLPDKAIDLIDEAASRVRLRSYTAPSDLKELEDKKKSVEAEKLSAVNAQEFERAAALRDEERKLDKEIKDKKENWHDMAGKSHDEVTPADIADIVSSWTGVPVTQLSTEESDRLLHMEDELHRRIVGQDEAVEAVSRAIRRGRVGLKDPKKPIGSFIFLGPTGVGKTELCKALAAAMFGDENAMIRLDMSEYMEKFSVQRLIGAPPGYVGYDEGGQLTEAVRRRPYSVILLDEMEKAHPDVFNVLLQVLDDGRLTDGQGRQVSFKNTIIIMTSNVGSKAIAELSGKDEEEMRHQVNAAMAQTFRPEFLNRIDDIVVFHPLGMAQIEKIVDIQLADVRARLAKERMTLAITPAAKQMLAVGGLDPVFGARPLKRLVQREVVDAIAAAIIDGTVREGDQVTVDVDKDGGFTVVCDNTPAATYEVPDAE